MAVKAAARKTPCESCKHTVRRAASGETNTQYIWCNGCGEWEIVNGKAYRPTGWR